MTQSQIAERMGYSQMHVSRLLARGLDRLRGQIVEPAERPAVSSVPPRRPRERDVQLYGRAHEKAARLAS
jgi:RNA polymerase sigma-B factor